MNKNTFPSEQLAKAFEEKFGIEVETLANIVGGGIMTIRVDCEDFTEEQAAYINGFEDCAVALVLKEGN